ncbi:MAG: DUF2256 domain-containing protein [Rhodospirillaceae bacterium]
MPAVALTHRKIDLPTKLCSVCHRPFAWRRRWRNCWQHIRYCSERCRNARNRPAAAHSGA